MWNEIYRDVILDYVSWRWFSDKSVCVSEVEYSSLWGYYLYMKNKKKPNHSKDKKETPKVKLNIVSEEKTDKASEEQKTESKVAKGETSETFRYYSFEDKRIQMRWFVNKLLSLCDDPINPWNMCSSDSYSEVLYFNLDYMKESGLFPFSINRPGAEPGKTDYTGYFESMFSEISNNVYKLKDVGFNLNTSKFHWLNEAGTTGDSWSTGFDTDYFIDIYFRPLFEAYLLFMDSNEKVIENGKSRPRVSIEKIEILEDKTEQGRVYIYINGDYEHSRDFSRNLRWSKLYELAKNQRIYRDKNVLDYFNYHPANPLYTIRGGFKVSAVLKDEDGYTVPNIEITLITKEKIARRRNSLKKS